MSDFGWRMDWITGVYEVRNTTGRWRDNIVAGAVRRVQALLLRQTKQQDL